MSDFTGFVIVPICLFIVGIAAAEILIQLMEAAP